MTEKNNPTVEDLEYKLVLIRDLAAPRELVWKAWTEPGRIKEWLGPGGCMTVESVRADPRAGGKFRIQMKAADGEYYTAAGTYLEVKPPEKLVYTWDWEKDGAGAEFGELEGKETRVTAEFFADGKRTQLVLTHGKFASEESRDRHQEGWREWMDRLAKHTEAKQVEAAG